MNERPLAELVAETVDRVCAGAEGALSEEEVLQRVLADEHFRILLDGYDMHDRSEGLEDMIERDIARMVHAALTGKT